MISYLRISGNLLNLPGNIDMEAVITLHTDAEFTQPQKKMINHWQKTDHLATATFSHWPIPSGGGVVRNMAATPAGDLYLACSGVNMVVVVRIGK